MFVSDKKLVMKPLPYHFDGLEPVIPERLVEHHYKLHQSHIDNLNGLKG